MAGVIKAAPCLLLLVIIMTINSGARAPCDKAFALATFSFDSNQYRRSSMWKAVPYFEVCVVILTLVTNWKIVTEIEGIRTSVGRLPTSSWRLLRSGVRCGGTL